MRPSLAVLVLLCACQDDPGTGSSGTAVDATVAPSPYVPAVALVSFDGDGEGFVEYGLDGVFDHETPHDTGSIHHEVAVIGLAAGQTWDWRAVLLDTDGTPQTSEPGTFAVPVAPLPAVTVDPPSGSTPAFDGWVMLAANGGLGGDSFVGFLDSDGNWVWWVEIPGSGVVTAKFGADGTSVLYGSYATNSGVDDGHLVRVSMDGRVREETIPFRGHHDFVEHADADTFAYLSFEPDPSGATDYGADTIRVVPQGTVDDGSSPIVFDTFENHDAVPGFVCPDVDLGNPGQRLGVQNVIEWTHGNSLVYLPSQNAYYLLARFTDWLLKIDADTGNVDWELNGGCGTFSPSDDFTLPGNEPLWSHGHLSDLWDGGALVFDNHDYPEPSGPSRVVQVSWDDTAFTAGVDLTIELPEELCPTPDCFNNAIGDARRMPDGRILSAWGNLPYVTIHSADGTALDWTATVGDGGQYAARLRYTDSLYELATDR